MKFADASVHLVGAGGAGLSGMARLHAARGVVVTGSDATRTSLLAGLAADGFDVWTGVDPDRLARRCSTVIHSAAVAVDHPEVVACERRGARRLLYAQALGELSVELSCIAVAGTHGKTTTSSLCASALRDGGVDCSHIIGGDIPDLGGNGRLGRSEWFVTEACEFNRSFHQLRSAAAAVLSVDPDHFDCYPDAAALHAAYAQFLAGVRPGGLAVVAEDVPETVLAGLASGVEVWRIGEQIAAAELTRHNGCCAFVPLLHGQRMPAVQLALPGDYQVGNALAALALALWAGARPVGACAGLGRLRSVRRRFELRVGNAGGQLIDDYAHHPTEIRAVVAAARQRFPGRRLLAVFQPHQHQRTLALLPEFAAALAAIDRCLVADIYAARETAVHRAQVSARDLVGAVRAAGGNCDYAGGIADVAASIAADRCRGDVVMIMGAGDIDSVVDDVLATL